MGLRLQLSAANVALASAQAAAATTEGIELVVGAPVGEAPSAKLTVEPPATGRRRANSAAAAAVAAGIVAVGRAEGPGYVKRMEEWAAGEAALPKQVMLQINTAAVQNVGPCYVDARHQKEQVDRRL